MTRQMHDHEGRTIVRLLSLRILLSLAGAFALTALGWFFASAASAAEASPPPLVNIVDEATGALGTVNDTVHTVATVVLPPRSGRTESSPSVVDSVHSTVRELDENVRGLLGQPVHRAVHASVDRPKTSARKAVSQSSTPRTSAAVRHRPEPAKALYPAPPTRHPVVERQLTAGTPVETGPPARHVPAPVSGGDQWTVPAAPASTGGAGTVHAPDAPAFATTSSVRDAGALVTGAVRPVGPVVLLEADAQPGVTPD
jgi:hypothetical protein